MTARNTTGVNTLANDEGLYRIPNLPPGTYNLQVSLPGFKTGLINGIKVRVAAVVRRDVVLEVGGIAEQVTVRASRNIVGSRSARGAAERAKDGR